MLTDYDPNLIHLPRNMKLLSQDNEEQNDDWEMQNKLKAFQQRENLNEEEQQRQFLHDQTLQNLPSIDQTLLNKFEEQPIPSIAHNKMIGLSIQIAGDFISGSLDEQQRQEITQMNEHLLWQRMQELLAEGEYKKGNVLEEGMEERPLLVEDNDKNQELPFIEQEEEQKEEINDFWQSLDEQKEKENLKNEEEKMQQLLEETQKKKEEQEKLQKEQQLAKKKQKKEKQKEVNLQIPQELLGEDGTKLLGKVIDLDSKYGKFKQNQIKKSALEKIGKLAARVPPNQTSLANNYDNEDKEALIPDSTNFWQNKSMTVSQLKGNELNLPRVKYIDLPRKFDRSLFGIDQQEGEEQKQEVDLMKWNQGELFLDNKYFYPDDKLFQEKKNLKQRNGQSSAGKLKIAFAENPKAGMINNLNNNNNNINENTQIEENRDTNQNFTSYEEQDSISLASIDKESAYIKTLFAEQNLEFDRRRCCICYDNLYSQVNRRDYFILIAGISLGKFYYKQFFTLEAFRILLLFTGFILLRNSMDLFFILAMILAIVFGIYNFLFPSFEIQSERILIRIFECIRCTTFIILFIIKDTSEDDIAKKFRLGLVIELIILFCIGLPLVIIIIQVTVYASKLIQHFNKKKQQKNLQSGENIL